MPAAQQQPQGRRQQGTAVQPVRQRQVAPRLAHQAQDRKRLLHRAGLLFQVAVAHLLGQLQQLLAQLEQRQGPLLPSMQPGRGHRQWSGQVRLCLQRRGHRAHQKRRTRNEAPAQRAALDRTQLGGQQRRGVPPDRGAQSKKVPRGSVHAPGIGRQQRRLEASTQQPGQGPRGWIPPSEGLDPSAAFPQLANAL
ncbi:MAG: hypothetical protein RMK29_19480 [Myxococcales bacterium]|nr:hypothetical protein [Myxococcota bacterium]MDW8283889.1 hypothetical protein [Myxococcales bacterium]